MGETPARSFTITLARQPEGVWLATSDEIPGLFVEGDTAGEARGEALEWGRELLADNLGYDFSQRRFSSSSKASGRPFRSRIP